MLSWLAEKVTDTAKYLLGIHELDFYPDQDSEVEPGKLSIISGSLEELDPPISAELFFSEVEAYLRWPIDPITEFVLKSCEVTENSPDEFWVKVVLDGKKLDSWGRGRGDGCDRVKSWKKIIINRKAMSLRTEDYVPEVVFGEWADKANTDTLVNAFELAMLKEPTRCEYVLLKDGERITSADLVGIMYGTFDPLIKGIKAQLNAKVQVAEADSIQVSGKKSIVSGPMDEFIDFDTYFDSMVVNTRKFFENFPDTAIEDVSESAFEAKTTVKKSDDTEALEPKKVSWNKETGVLTIEFYTVGAESVASKSYRVLHKSPLRMEAWVEDEKGERSMTRGLLKQVSTEVNTTIG